MLGNRRWYMVLLAGVGLLGGMGLGLWYGWLVDPVEYTDTDVAHLQPVYQDDMLLMISEAYDLDRDLGTARARVALLALPDPTSAVADRAEKAIAQNAPDPHVLALVRLATAMGVQRDAFIPFLSPSDDAR